MADYQKMYYCICRAVSKAIDAPPEEGKQILRQALLEEDTNILTCGEAGAEERQDSMSIGADLGLPASVRNKLMCFSSERDALRRQIESLELQKRELLSEEERLTTMPVEQLLEINHVQQSSVAEQLEDLYARYASLHINTEVKRRDIYKMLDQLCQTAPLDHVFIALKQILFMAQEETHSCP